MGASIPRDSLSQSMSRSFFGNEPPKLTTQAERRRTMPGGPLLPRVPRNPDATTARRIGRALNSPAIQK